MLDLMWLIPALPLTGFLILLVFGRRLGDPLAGYFAALMVFGAFIVSLLGYFQLRSDTPDQRERIDTLFTWVPVSSLQIDVPILADPLSLTMCLFVTGIAFLIHLYAIGYMKGDPKFSKFFMYMNLFVASMTLLVLGGNLVMTFIGWEGVGTCSYFLISFWHERDSAATAGKKAFITNRVGDFGFMIAIFLTFEAVGTLNYESLNGAALTGQLAESTATAIAMMLFVGAVGKSAQIPLYLWLPDAMEGPTPVSALIHAATMVTAGVYLMVRVNPVLAASAGWVPELIAWTGAITALFAASIAVAQTDIKKVLAYSTVSQLGFMFLAIGSGAYVAALFHMVMHAFFKALLFLGAGSVIHGMHHEQDMRRMGALRKLMPITSVTFIIGWLAIAGVPPFSGFWSKDEILLYVLADSLPLYIIAITAAMLTAFYMTRQVIMVFFGEAQWETKAEEHGAHGEFKPHESPAIMTIPLVVLSVLTIFGGLIQLPSFGWIPGRAQHQLENWTAPVLHASEAKIDSTWAYGHQGILVIIAVTSGLIGITLGWLVYKRHKLKVFEPQIMAEGWRYDQTVSAFMGGPGRKMFEFVAWFDAKVIDGAVMGVATLVKRAGSTASKSQTGNVRNYAGIIGIGVVLLLAWFVIGMGVL